MSRSIMQRAVDWGRRSSPWLLRFNGGSCGGCDAELLAALTPRYDMERLGVQEAGLPAQADILLCTGPVTLHNRDHLRQVYEQMGEPKFVLAVGACACGGGVFHDSYCVAGAVDTVIPVDIYLPGCAVRPQEIVAAVDKLLQAWAQAQRQADRVED